MSLHKFSWIRRTLRPTKIPSDLATFTCSFPSGDRVKATVGYLGRQPQPALPPEAELALSVEVESPNFPGHVIEFRAIYHHYSTPHTRAHHIILPEHLKVELAYVNFGAGIAQVDSLYNAQLTPYSTYIATALGQYLAKLRPDLWPDLSLVWCLNHLYTSKSLNAYAPPLPSLAISQSQWMTWASHYLSKDTAAWLLTHPDKEVRILVNRLWQEKQAAINQSARLVLP